MKPVCNLVLSSLVWCFPLIASAGKPYVFTILGDTVGVGGHTAAYDINARGQVVGGENSHAFVWTPNSPNGTVGSKVNLGGLTGNDSTIANSINSFGQVVGWSQSRSVSGFQFRPFLWTPAIPNGTSGSMVGLGHLSLPGAKARSFAYGLNSFGQVIGRTDSGGDHAFLWTPNTINATTGSISGLPYPDGFDQSSGRDINSRGQLAGDASRNFGAERRAFLWTSTADGTFASTTNLGDLPGGGDESSAQAINEYGQAVGFSDTETGFRAFLWTPNVANGIDGAMIELETLANDPEALAEDINSLGQVVGCSGFSVLAAEQTRAFLWTPSTPNGTSGTIIDLNSFIDSTSAAVWSLRSANAINDRGQIVGRAEYDPDGPGGFEPEYHAFLLSPVPEPSVSLLISTTAIVLATYARRKRHNGTL
jgi:probable HAF family extracellular repeat protein